MSRLVEILDPEGAVHYRRPEDHPLLPGVGAPCGLRFGDYSWAARHSMNCVDCHAAVQEKRR